MAVTARCDERRSSLPAPAPPGYKQVAPQSGVLKPLG